MMKKIIFLTLFMATILQNSSAQISIGGMAGVNFSNYIIDHNIQDRELIDPEIDLGYFIGASSSFSLGEKMKILADGKYTIKGHKYVDGDVILSRYRADYLEFIPRLEYKPVEFIGIAVGLNIGANIGGSFKSGEDDWQNFSNSLNLFGANIAIGAAIRGYLSNFFIEAGYEHGLNNISEINLTDRNGESLGAYNSYFRNFNLGVGYMFEL